MKTKLLFAIAILTSTSIASADDETAAAARKRGDAAMKANRIHEACEAYAASIKLEAVIETELSLATCYEKDGKPASAARLLRAAAEKDSNADRRQKSTAKAAKLEAKAPKLRFAINPVPPGLVVKVDGVEVQHTADVLVDTGPHEVIATAPGFAGRATAPVDRERAILDVIIRMEPVAEAAPAPMKSEMTPPAATASAEAAVSTTVMPAPMDTPAKSSSSSNRKRNGIILGAGGVALLAGSALLFKLSSDKFDDEQALCPGDRCASPADLAEAKSMLSDGRTMRGTSIGLGIAGGLAIAASAYLLLTPSEKESNMSFYVAPGGGGIGYAGSF